MALSQMAVPYLHMFSLPGSIRTTPLETDLGPSGLGWAVAGALVSVLAYDVQDRGCSVSVTAPYSGSASMQP